ncbi:hypothetical protein WH95_02110 [Kiloniella litopenaei]|uniref:Uncharacterized protein n=1 Tax=Kiloniella litopenaei TaxID=1549748 RepID=A0A0M2RCL7_9PROT|nr:hypothetical protein WH95_02110 [Kiloniella litopenaei]
MLPISKLNFVIGAAVLWRSYPDLFDPDWFPVKAGTALKIIIIRGLGMGNPLRRTKQGPDITLKNKVLERVYVF